MMLVGVVPKLVSTVERKVLDVIKFFECNG